MTISENKLETLKNKHKNAKPGEMIPLEPSPKERSIRSHYEPVKPRETNMKKLNQAIENEITATVTGGKSKMPEFVKPRETNMDALNKKIEKEISDIVTGGKVKK